MRASRTMHSGPDERMDYMNVQVRSDIRKVYSQFGLNWECERRRLAPSRTWQLQRALACLQALRRDAGGVGVVPERGLTRRSSACPLAVYGSFDTRAHARSRSSRKLELRALL